MVATADEILRAAEARIAPLTGETAGYFVLGAADGLGGVEGRLALTAVGLTEDGSVRVGRMDAGAAGELEGDLRRLLSRLLSLAPPGVPALVRVARAPESRGIEHLVSELEAALIPVNRSAARRALARLCRDVSRAKTAGKLPPAREPEDAPATVVAQAEPAPRVIVAERPTPPARPATPPPPVAIAVEIPPPPLVEFTPRPAVEVSGPGQTPVVCVAEPNAEVATRTVTPVIPPTAAEPVAPMSPLDLPVAAFEDVASEAEKTPFLGTWPGALPVVTALRPALTVVAVAAAEPEEEHDTDHVPPVVFDDDVPLVVEFVEEAAPEAIAVAEVEPAVVELASAVVSDDLIVPGDPEEPLVFVADELVVPASDEPETPVRAPSDDEEASWMTALFGTTDDGLSEAVTPEAWARIGHVMTDEPIAFGGSPADVEEPVLHVEEPAIDVKEPAAYEPLVAAEASPAHPESGYRRKPAAASLDLTAPWPPTAPSSPVAPPVEEPRPMAFFAFEDDDEIPASEEFAAALRDGDAGIDASFLPIVVPAMRSTDEDVHDALEPLMQAAAEAFVSAAGEKEAAALAASEREALYLPSEPPFVPVAIVAAPYQPRQSDVQQLIAGFGDGGASSLTDVARELQRFAGIGGTPDPGAVAISPRLRKPVAPGR